MTERRYTEDEVAAIFARAAEAQQTHRRALPPADGMTLAEVQEIGREVGLPPELVAQAARSLDWGDPPASRTFLGLPIGVGRTIELERRLADAEWEQLVADLRETFDARGTVRYDGPFRQWTNGNLQVLLEPTPTGHRLRLRTVKGSARQLLSTGVAILGIAAAALVAAAAAGRLSDVTAALVFLSAIGVGAFGVGALGLPGWARLRQRQMDGIAERVAIATGTGTPADQRRPGVDPASDQS